MTPSLRLGRRWGRVWLRTMPARLRELTHGWQYRRHVLVQRHAGLCGKEFVSGVGVLVQLANAKTLLLFSRRIHRFIDTVYTVKVAFPNFTVLLNYTVYTVFMRYNRSIGAQL